MHLLLRRRDKRRAERIEQIRNAADPWAELYGHVRPPAVTAGASASNSEWAKLPQGSAPPSPQRHSTRAASHVRSTATAPEPTAAPRTVAVTNPSRTAAPTDAGDEQNELEARLRVWQQRMPLKRAAPPPRVLPAPSLRRKPREADDGAM